MIQISVVKNNQEYPLYLADNSRASIEEFEAIFDFDAAIKGGYSMNVKVPVEGNERYLNYAHSAYTRGSLYFFDVVVYEAEVAAYRAVLTIDKANVYFNNKFFDCDLIFQSFSTSIKDKLLKDVLDKEIILCNDLEDISSDIQDFFIENSWPQAPVQFPELRIINDDEEEVIANQWNHLNQTFKDVYPNLSDFSNPTIPQPYYAEVLRELFRAKGYQVAGEIWGDVFFRSQLMPSFKPAYNARRVNELVLETNEDIVVNGRTPIEWLSVEWNTTNFNAEPPTTTIMDAAQQGTNFVQIVEVELRIKTIDPGGKVRLYRRDFGQPYNSAYSVVDFWALDGDVITYTFYGAVEYLNSLHLACVDNNYEPNELTTADFPVSDQVTFILEKGSKIKQYFTQNFDFPERRRYLRQSMNLNEMVPPTLLASEFLVAVKSMFQLKIDIDDVSKTVHISRSSDLKKRPTFKMQNVLDGFEKDPQTSKKFRLKWQNAVENAEGFQSIGSVPNRESIAVTFFQFGVKYIVFVIAENAYYIREDDAWKFYSIRNDDFDYGNGEDLVVIDIPVSLVEMRSDVTGDELGILPTIKRTSTGNYLGDESEAWELMIMNYLGVQPNIGGKEKPFATSATTLYDGTPILSGHLILNHQATSVFNNYQKPLLDILLNHEIYTFRTIGKYSSLRSSLLRKIIEHNGNHYIEKARLGQIGTEESINKIEMIRI